MTSAYTKHVPHRSQPSLPIYHPRPWFHLLTAPEDYAEEAAFYRHLLTEACVKPPIDTVLELGSGGGNNALHMKAHFQLTLTDLSPQMLDLSRTINPELEHIQGDMRTLRLDREFDAVFVHDAVVYMTTEDDLAAAIRTAFVHCRPGGGALFAPDHTRENFKPSTDHGGHDGADGRALRYLEWTWDPDPTDTAYTVDFAYLLREADGSVHVEQDRHIEGVVPARDLAASAGRGRLPGASSCPSTTRSSNPASYEVFVATKP